MKTNNEIMRPKNFKLYNFEAISEIFKKLENRQKDSNLKEISIYIVKYIFVFDKTF